MTQNQDKFITMVGFARRAGKIVFGIDKLKQARGIKLLAVSDTASDNLMSEMNKLSSKIKAPLVIAASLENIVGNNIKALGLTDANMARAAAEYVSEAGGAVYKINR